MIRALFNYHNEQSNGSVFNISAKYLHYLSNMQALLFSFMLKMFITHLFSCRTRKVPALLLVIVKFHIACEMLLQHFTKSLTYKKGIQSIHKGATAFFFHFAKYIECMISFSVCFLH